MVVSTCCNTTVLGAYRRTNTHKGVHEYVDGAKRRYMSIGPDKVIPTGVFRRRKPPHPGAVADLKNITMLELLHRCDWLTLAKEQHDAFWLECPVEREQETWPIYQEVVQRGACNRGVRMKFPAEFKRYLADGTVQKVPHVIA